ncbi:MAG TPA: preprotein translocase subunit SecG [Acidimicrobiia bacterium]
MQKDSAVSIVVAILAGIHALVSLGLIGLILLHAGRGGGMSDMFGGGMGGSYGGGTVMERNLDRITVAAAIVFTLTTVGLLTLDRA